MLIKNIDFEMLNRAFITFRQTGFKDMIFKFFFIHNLFVTDGEKTRIRRIKEKKKKFSS